MKKKLNLISSCIKTVGTNASTVVRASIASSVASDSEHRDQVIWAGFDRLEIGPASFRHVLLLGYQNGFQVIDVEDASDFTVLVSKRGGPVTFLQLLHRPAKSDDKFTPLHPLLMVVTGDESPRSVGQNRTYLSAPGRDGSNVSPSGTSVDSPTVVRFYSLQSNCYVKVLRFRSTVFMVRCSPTIVAVGLEKEIHCIDAVTLENKFTVPTYPVPRSGGQGKAGVNFGYGPLAVGPRWLAYASNKLIVSNSGRLSPMNLTPGISPSTSPNGSLVAHYAMESSKHLAAGIRTLGNKGYDTFSKYYPEMLQDRPIASLKPGSKAGNASSEVDNAGMVIVKDVVSEAAISQFRAHPSPLSALCFDPSGTLLVTASIHGNNVNIFRIMPCTRTGSSNQNHDWNSSHVLLYKLHRGITSAVIQDISFSRYCQWISIVTSKGTCHVFALSPFGGDAGYRPHWSRGHLINPVRSLPWWSTPSFVVEEQPFPPPPPLTLSVVGRIKNNSSFVGKSDIPSGAVASVFHNSMTTHKQDVLKMSNSLDHLLVYTPSGYVVQYELLPSMGIQNVDAGLENQQVPYQPSQDEELGVAFQSRQWWQVCRRLDSPEREECIPATSVYNEGEKLVKGDSLQKIDSLKQNDRVHLFLSNAEVQINSGRLPLWQNTKVHFYVMGSVSVEGFTGGETLIENILCHEVDIRRKDLLPVYEQFDNIKSGWDDRACNVRKHSASSLDSGRSREKTSDESVIFLSKPESVSSTESSDGGSSRRTENLLDLDPVNELYFEQKISTSPSLLNQKVQNRNEAALFPSELYMPAMSQMNGNSGTSRMTSTPFFTADYFEIKDPPNVSSGPQKTIDYEGCFQDDVSNKITGSTTDYGENDGNQCGTETSENEGEEDELFGDMFDLSEEG